MNDRKLRIDHRKGKGAGGQEVGEIISFEKWTEQGTDRYASQDLGLGFTKRSMVGVVLYPYNC